MRCGAGISRSLGRDELVGEAHRVQGDHILERAQRDQVGLVVEDEAADPDPVRALQRRVQQQVGLVAELAGAEVVGAVVVDRVDLLAPGEVLDLDHVRAGAVGRGDLLLGERHVGAGADFEAFHGLAVGNLLALLHAHAPVFDRGAVGA